MADRFDDELRHRLDDAIAEISRSRVARAAPGVVRHASRVRRRRIALNAAAAAFAVTAAAVAVPRLGGPPAPDTLGQLPERTEASPSARPSTGSAAPSRPASADPGRRPSAKPTHRPSSSGGTTRPEPSPTATARPVSPHCPPVLAETPAPDGVGVSVTPATRRIGRGNRLTLTVTVRNDGLLPVEYTRGGQRYDFWVTDPRDGRVWQWSAGQAFTDELVTERLEAGEQQSASETWNLVPCRGRNGEEASPLAPGSYLVRALWVANGTSGTSWWSEPVTVEVT